MLALPLPISDPLTSLHSELGQPIYPTLQVSTIIGTAVKAERDDQAYTEGIAIWVAVLVVSLVGECGAMGRALYWVDATWKEGSWDSTLPKLLGGCVGKACRP